MRVCARTKEKHDDLCYMECKMQNYLHFKQYTPKLNNNKMVSQLTTAAKIYTA